MLLNGETCTANRSQLTGKSGCGPEALRGLTERRSEAAPANAIVEEVQRREASFLILAVILLAASAAGWIGRLGVEYDEAHFLPAAAQLARGSSEALRPPAGIYVFGRPFPFMTMAYVGGLDTLIYAVPYAIFGTNPIVHRLTNLLLGALVLLLAYALARQLHSPLAGGFTVALLLVDLEFLLHVPTNFGPFLVQMLCGTAGLWLLSKWWEGAGSGYLVCAAFLFGLGVQEKLTFVWLIAALLAGCVVYWRQIAGAVTWRGVLLAPIAGVVAMAPVLWYAWGFPEVVFGYARSSASVTNWSQVLSQRWLQLQYLLDGQFTPGFLLGGTHPPFARQSYVTWLLVAAAATLFLGWLLNWEPPRAAFLGMIFSAAFFGCNLIFPEAGRLHHFLLMEPMLQVTLGVVLAWWWRLTYVRLPIILLLALMAASTVRHLQWFSAEVARTGGGIHWSAQINDLVAWAAANPHLHFYTGSWGLARQLMTFPERPLSIHERYFDILGDPEPALRASLPRRDSVWIFSNALPMYREQREKIFACARRLGYEPREYARIGTLYQAYSFLPAEATFVWRAVPAQLVIEGQADRYRVTLEADWKQMRSLRAELVNAKGQVIGTYSRPFEYYPPIERQLTLEFGPNLYPDYFLGGAPSVAAQAHGLRLSYEGTARLTVVAAAVAEAR